METYIFNAICTHVVDGDTFDCTIDLGFHLTSLQRLRLHGVNTPELRSSNPEEREAAQKAKDYVIEMVMGKNLKVQTYKDDAFGRYLAKVFIPLESTSYSNVQAYVCLNDLLIEEGLAVPYMEDTLLF